MNLRIHFKLSIDTFIWVIAGIMAYLLRFDFDFTVLTGGVLFRFLLTVPLKYLLSFLFGHHKTSWRYSHFMDLKGPFLSVFTYTVIYLTAAFILRGTVLIPYSVPFIEAALAMMGFILVRKTTRYVLRERKTAAQRSLLSGDLKRVLIVGAGEAGTLISNEMLRHPELGMLPVGFLDDSNYKQNQTIKGIKVYGRISDMQKLVLQLNIDEIIITLPSESGEVIRRIVNEIQKIKMPHRIMPGLSDFITGKVSIRQLRRVQVEDLLRRKAIELDTRKIQAYIRGKRILVTGAGGSIGSEIVRQIIRFSPNRICLLGRGENSIFEIMRECQSIFPDIEIDVRICDVRDNTTLKRIFEAFQPEVVFHAAAHKHVYLMEENPDQAILNNVGGTRNLVNLALEHKVKYFVNISTDKAINPTSVMGATKRMAEYIVQQASAKAEEDQVFVSVRFGNVLGSRGSVVPIFQKQIEKGGPVTVTDPRMKRYFMTIPEASQLVLQAGALGINGAVFILDMGEPVFIVDMAKDLIRLSGLEPDKDIQIVFTGIKKGEKLYEELITDEEGTHLTQHAQIMIASINGVPKQFDEDLNNLFNLAKQGQNKLLREHLLALAKQIVPNS